jgi:hypothetical protein
MRPFRRGSKARNIQEQTKQKNIEEAKLAQGHCLAKGS